MAKRAASPDDDSIIVVAALDVCNICDEISKFKLIFGILSRKPRGLAGLEERNQKKLTLKKKKQVCIAFLY